MAGDDPGPAGSDGLFTARQIVGTVTAVSSHRRLILNMLRIISEKRCSSTGKVEHLTIKTLRGKIAVFLLEKAKEAGTTTFMLPFNRNELAEYLNVARPSLSGTDG